MRERKRIVVHGRVQGVGFRWFVVQRAKEMSIAGWVRNNADGTVEIEAEGEMESLQLFIHQIDTGPRFARISGLDISEQTPQQSERSFRVIF